ncbi:hypothetical protein MHYP_G00134290 [Metynnis hypsauchen]
MRRADKYSQYCCTPRKGLDSVVAVSVSPHLEGGLKKGPGHLTPQQTALITSARSCLAPVTAGDGGTLEDCQSLSQMEPSRIHPFSHLSAN